MHPSLVVALVIVLTGCAATPAPDAPPADAAAEKSLMPGTIGAVVVPAPGGVRIEALAADGPAARAGLQVGDVIVRCGREPIRTVRMFNQQVLDTRPGEKLRLDVRRDEEERTVQVDVTQLRIATRL